MTPRHHINPIRESIKYLLLGTWPVTGGDIEDLALRRPKKELKTSWFKKLLVACTAATAAASTMMVSPINANANQISVTPGSAKVSSVSPEIIPSPATSIEEVVMPNGVTIHNSGQEAINAFSKLVNEYPKIWEDTGSAELPEENWTTIPLKSDWERRVSGMAKIYPLAAKDRELIDQTFDKLQDLGRLSYTTDCTPFSYPCFVVWKPTADGGRAGRAVIDIRGLNAITVPDAYPLPLQSEIIIAVRRLSINFSGGLHCLFLSMESASQR